MTGTEPSWRLTGQERRRVLGAVAATAACFAGPLGPLLVAGFDILYDRRHLIFKSTGAPIQAVGADRSLLALSTLHDTKTAQHATLSVSTKLTGSARRMGLRNGDPVGVLLTSNAFAHTGNGLIVPARIGELTRITVPNGTYSLTALGSRQDLLFSAPAPYQVAAGDTASLHHGNRELALSLAPSVPLLESAAYPAPFARAIGTDEMAGRVASTLPRHTGDRFRLAPALPATAFFPRPPHQCDRCLASFRTAVALRRHFANQHPVVNSWRSFWGY